MALAVDDECVVATRAVLADPEIVVARPNEPVRDANDASRQRGRRWDYPVEGTFLAWLVVDAAKPSPARPCEAAVPAAIASITSNIACLGCVGVARCKWVLRPTSPEVVGKHVMLAGEPGDRTRQPFGYLQYDVDDLFAFDTPILFQGSQKEAYLDRLREAQSDFILDEEIGSVKTAMTEKELQTSLVVPPSIFSSLLLGELVTVKSLPFTSQLRYHDIVDGFPLRYVVKYHWKQWKREALEPHNDQARSVADSTASKSHDFLKAPRGCVGFRVRRDLKAATLKSKFDPVKLLRCVDFQHELRSEKKFTPALRKARKIDENPSDEEVVDRDPKDDPARTTRQRARHKGDVLIMLLERRQFDCWYHDGLIESIHVYSDGSPVVGVELQGQVVDFILTNGEVHKRTLPGAELAYGLFSATQKCVSLLWVVFLTLGPEKAKLKVAMNHVRSLTTDNGTEINLNRCPDIIDAFYMWMQGEELAALKPYVDQNSRLMPNSLRVIGIGHTAGGIVKEVVNSYPAWPVIDVQIRSLVRFFRNVSYRQHLKVVLRGRCNTKCLDTFEASFIKWRYETLATAVDDLLRMKAVCLLMREEFFINVRDKESIKRAVAAARDLDFWKFLEGPGREVILEIEKLRRWGMICSCQKCKELRDEGKKHLRCPRNSRRLGEYADEVRKRCLAFDAATLDYTAAKCGGDERLAENTRSMLRKTRSLLELRTKYLLLLPWRLTAADTPDGARDCIRQLDERGVERSQR